MDERATPTLEAVHTTVVIVVATVPAVTQRRIRQMSPVREAVVFSWSERHAMVRIFLDQSHVGDAALRTREAVKWFGEE